MVVNVSAVLEIDYRFYFDSNMVYYISK